MSWLETCMIRDMWVTHGMIRTMCQATKREISESRGERISGGKTKRRKKRKREIEGEERERERGKGRKTAVLLMIFDVSTVGIRRVKS